MDQDEIKTARKRHSGIASGMSAYQQQIGDSEMDMMIRMHDSSSEEETSSGEEESSSEESEESAGHEEEKEPETVKNEPRLLVSNDNSQR